jgi:hypothetical protein
MLCTEMIAIGCEKLAKHSYTLYAQMCAVLRHTVCANVRRSQTHCVRKCAPFSDTVCANVRRLWVLHSWETAVLKG